MIIIILLMTKYKNNNDINNNNGDYKEKYDKSNFHNCIYNDNNECNKRSRGTSNTWNR